MAGIVIRAVDRTDIDRSLPHGVYTNKWSQKISNTYKKKNNMLENDKSYGEKKQSRSG